MLLGRLATNMLLGRLATSMLLGRLATNQQQACCWDVKQPRDFRLKGHHYCVHGTSRYMPATGFIRFEPAACGVCGLYQYVHSAGVIGCAQQMGSPVNDGNNGALGPCCWDVKQQTNNNSPLVRYRHVCVKAFYLASPTCG